MIVPGEISLPDVKENTVMEEPNDNEDNEHEMNKLSDIKFIQERRSIKKRCRLRAKEEENSKSILGRINQQIDEILSI